jgi:hypothetical protein
MSGTVNYPKVIDQLTDVIKELNVGFAPCGAAAPAAPSEETRRADAVGLLKELMSALEQGGADAAAAAAEHGASAEWWNDDPIGNGGTGKGFTPVPSSKIRPPEKPGYRVEWFFDRWIYVPLKVKGKGGSIKN